MRSTTRRFARRASPSGEASRAHVHAVHDVLRVGRIYSVLLYTPPELMDAFAYVMRRLLRESLRAFKPLYVRDAALRAADVVEVIMKELHAQYHLELSEDLLDVIASHVPRAVGVRRLLRSGEDSRFPTYPMQALKNAVAWLYNQGKVGVDRQTQLVTRVMTPLRELAARQDGFDASVAVHRLVALAVAAVQLARGVASIPQGPSWSALTFRNNMARHGDIIDAVERVGVALLTKPAPMLAVSTPTAAPASALLATTSSLTSASASSGSMATSSAAAAIALIHALARNTWQDATLAPPSSRHANAGTVLLRRMAENAQNTPLTRLRRDFTDLARLGFIATGIKADDAVWSQLTVERATAVVNALTKIANMQRAPELASFADETSSLGILRRLRYLNHASISFERAKELFGDVSETAADDDQPPTIHPHTSSNTLGHASTGSAPLEERHSHRGQPSCASKQEGTVATLRVGTRT